MFALPVGVMAQTDSLEIQEPQVEKPRSVTSVVCVVTRSVGMR